MSYKNEMNIDEDKLKLYLNTRKNFIEFKRFSGIAEIVSGLSMFITLICSNFDSISLNTTMLLCIGFFISLAILLLGILKFVSSIKNYYTIDLCFKEISSLDDTKKRVQYVIIVKDTVSGKYLLIYNTPWQCYLFHSFSSDMIISSTHSIEQMLLDTCIKTLEIKNQKLKIKHIGTLNSYKINVGEKCFMNYEFKFYLVSGITLQNSKKRLKINGNKFKWMSIDKMYANKQMMKKNWDVIDYVNNHTNISKI